MAAETVVVTGGAGFIGAHTVQLLAGHGYHVVVVDDFSAGPPALPLPRSAEVLRLDVTRRDLGRVLAERVGHARGVIHLAAVVSVEAAARRPLRTVEVNVLGTASALAAAEALGASVFVYASSAAVYGEPRTIPIPETHPTRPRSLYGDTKLMGEMLAERWSERGLRVVALRYFNVYGPGMRPGPYAGVVLRFAEALLRGRSPVIYGDGRQTRDFVYVEDVARANLLALEREEARGAINIGTGVETSINKLYELMCSLVGRCPPPRYAPPRPGDVRRSAADTERARRLLGWQPRTTLREGLEKTIEYVRERLRAHNS